MFTKPQLSSVLLLVILVSGVCLAEKRPIVEQAHPTLIDTARLIVTHRPEIMLLGWVSKHEVAIVDNVHLYMVHDLDTGKETEQTAYLMEKYRQGHTVGHSFQQRWEWKKVPHSMQNRLASHLNHLPPNTEICDVWPSPSRRSWLLRVQYTSKTGPTSLQNQQSTRKVHYTPYAAYWIVRQDGSNPFLLGAQPGKQDGDFLEYSRPGRAYRSLLYGPHWSPDETQIGFVFGEALYILPVH